MKSSHCGLACIIGFALLAAPTFWSSPGIAGDCVCPIEVIGCGHRGTGKNGGDAPYPENTIPSLVQAVAEGADMVEVDVVHSADGVLVLIHDDTVDRTTDGSGCVGDLTVAELQALDAGVGTAMEGQGVTIPTLAEALGAVDIPFNIELKINDTQSCPDSDLPAMAADVVAAIQNDLGDRRIVVSSFDADVLSEVELVDATVDTGLLSFNDADAQLAEAQGFDALNLLATLASEEVVADVHGRGLALNVWTENDEQRMGELIDLGVDMVITDEPDVFVSVRSERCEQLEPTCPGAASPAPQEEDSGGCATTGAAGSPPSRPWLLALASLWLGAQRRQRRPS